MQLGMIGLGRMGANLVRRVMRAGHECVVYDRNVDAVHELAAEGALGADSVGDLKEKLSAPRAVWVMVPAGSVTDSVIDELSDTHDAGDIVIEVVHSYLRTDIRHSEQM